MTDGQHIMNNGMTDEYACVMLV